MLELDNIHMHRKETLEKSREQRSLQAYHEIYFVPVGLKVIEKAVVISSIASNMVKTKNKTHYSSMMLLKQLCKTACCYKVFLW